MIPDQEEPSTFGYVVAAFSFVPGIGILIGLVVCLRGLISKAPSAKKLARIALGGIAFNIVIYSALFYFGFAKRGGVYDDLRAKMAASNLTTLVQAIEFYNVQNGRYPDTLQTLQKSLPKDSLVFVFDPTDVKLSGQPRFFYYELLDPQHYYLRSVGPDGVPFTADDIVPNLSAPPGGNVGLLIEREKK
ncbi:type II secretion system protein G [Sinimarinibacterium sp. CAU 1509]|uniref:type II secretion system protein GspG n=1 Tax=Sinimarinibacterium sp. CAU 1509 TaxID=2562283 RepID=UPI0010AB6BF5|nr:type II secretion system protein GspG [Sinimarinibacterium sp. CAU 1509]TJY58319.1 type II secretion system protein G [Sinimarinibacterium sp. CAU 1509]